jgi:hypothetical protein
MNPILRNILAVIAGLLVGSMVNGALIAISGSIIAPPEGADVTTMEGLKASMHLFGPKHFLFPFLAHALGTLVGAWLAVKLAASRHMAMALTAAGFFMLGGIINVAMLPSPLWFGILDIVGAYVPMGYLGYKLAAKKS